MKYILNGTITNTANQSVPIVQVLGYDKDPTTADDLLGKAITDKQGRYTISYNREDFDQPKRDKGGADIYIVVQDPKGKELATSKVHNNCPQEMTINLQIPNVMKDSNKPKTSIKGSIQHPECTNLSKYNKTLKLELYALTLSGEQKLQDIPYDEEGPFHIALEQGDQAVQYVVRLVYGEGRKKELIGSSAKLCACKTHDLSFYFDPKRYEILLPYLIEQVKPHLGKLSLIELNEEQLQQLVCLSKQPINEIRRLQKAYRWQKEALATMEGFLKKPDESKNDATYFKNLQTHFKQYIANPTVGLSILFVLAKNSMDSLQEALQISANALQSQVKKAIEAKEIPPLGANIAQAQQITSIKKRLPETSAKFNYQEALLYLRNAYLFNALYDKRLYDAKILYISSLSYSDKAALLEIALQHKGLDAVYDESSKVDLNAKQSAFKSEYEALVKLDTLLEHFPRLLHFSVQKATKGRKIDFDLIYKWNYEQWLDHIKKQKSEPKFPDKYKGSKQAEEDYATHISYGIQKENPIGALVSALGEASFPNKEKIKNLLESHPGFEVGKATVYSYFTTDKKDKEKVWVDSRSFDDLKELSRVTTLIGDNLQAGIIDFLYQKRETSSGETFRLTSATAIYNYGKGNLIIDMTAWGFPEKLAEQIYCRAYASYRTAVFLASQYQVYERKDALIPQVLQTNGKVPTQPISGMVNMETLFGSMEYCSCGHCQSVLSPAAYMTDLLHWLKSDVVCDNGRNGYQPIAARRPDIGEIQLSCKNTNTVMPYIDLVNEQLAINLQSSPNYSVLQTSWDTEQLLVEPEHEAVLATSYNLLKKTTYPLSLPYDALWHQSRAYLEKLGTSQSELIQLFSSQNSPAFFTKNWAKAYLGINDKVFEILKEQSPNTTFWKDYLGLSGITKNLGHLLSALDISKDLFQKIYEIKFVANVPLALSGAPTACDWDKFTISSTLTPNIMHRFVRFLRLYNLLDLSVDQLNDLILIQNNQLDEAKLIELAGTIYISKTYGLTLETLTDWLSGSVDRETELAAFIGVSNSEMTDYLSKFSSSVFPSNAARLYFFINQSRKFDSYGISMNDYETYNVNFSTDAKNLWDSIELAVKKFPGALDNNNVPQFINPTNELLIPELRIELVRILVDKFQIDAATINRLCPTTNIEGVDYTLDFYLLKLIFEEADWALTISSIFNPIYEYLSYIQLFKSTFDLTDETWSEINRSTSDFLRTYFFNNLNNNHTLQNISWYANLVSLHQKIEQPWNILLDEISEFSASPVYHSNIFTNLYADYNTHLNEVQFKDGFNQALPNASTSNDLVEVLSLTNLMIDASITTNVLPSKLSSWASNSPFTVAVRDQIKTELRNKYQDFTKWAKAITPLHNEFRTKLRDALVKYYIHHKTVNGASFANIAGLYAYYLLDSEMEACMKTSRILLAISSIQLLVHRGMMGLESNFCLDEKDKKQWKWRKNYRVWEANKKVFLFPENWIEPELRLDKSPFFEELEDTLLQDEINTENSEKAVSNYLTKFKEISRLDIRAQYFDDETKILHVFARTWTEPFVYYYRTREPDMKWNPWESIEVDISGNHLIPTIFNRRLYLFFPLFIDQQHKKIKRTIDGELQNAPYLEVKMCYTKLEYGKWSAKKILDGTLLAGDYAGLGVYNNLDNKLGQSIPPTTIRDVDNPDFNLFIWFGGSPFPRFGRGEYPDLYSPHGPKKREYISGDTYRGNMVFDNANFQDYTKVSLEKDRFYFWPSLNNATGDLTIHVRRDFHEDLKTYHVGENEIAYEDCFLINACDEKVSITPAVITEPGLHDKRFLAQPYLTVPYAQQLIKGQDYENEGNGLFIKKERTHRGDFFEIVRKTNGNYVLTYPQQYKDAMWNRPFFYSDDRHTYFIERAEVESCSTVVRNLYSPNSRSKNRYQVECFTNKTQTSKYLVHNHEHPFACLLTSEFNRFGIDGLLDSNNPLIKRQKYDKNYFNAEYTPNLTFIKYPLPKEEYDFTRTGSHSDYNWELFFHIPSLIARQLRISGKFEESIRWLQFVFDPTNREVNEYGSLRFWKIKPFMKDVSDDSIDNLLRLLSVSSPNPGQEAQRKAFLHQIEDWENNPFEPHRIASFRFRAYMLWTVMEYVQILTDWGDMLFRQDSMESINEATQLYIMAAEIIGKRPESITKKSNPVTATYNAVKNGLDAFSNIAIALEDQTISISTSLCNCCSGYGDAGMSLPDLLFCIPNNPKIVEMWDTVEDRLFKIRHCMNIDGQIRELPLFQPPIDPALLVRATAMGLDIGAVLNDINSPEPHYRYNYLLQKANEFTGEVKALGGALLSALEKKDAEELGQLRQVHEQNILKATRNIKKMSVEEAKHNLASAQHSKKLIEIRLAEYEGKEYMNAKETKSLDLTLKANKNMDREQTTMLLAKIFALIPQFHVGLAAAVETGGRTLSDLTVAVGTTFGVAASIQRNSAGIASTYGSYDRRKEDWNFQIKTAKEELNQIEKQILSAEIRLAIAEKDLENHELQIRQSQEVYDYVKNKFTNLKLYSWMCNQLMKLHRRAYELAYEMAKNAEKAMKKELAINDSISYIQFGNWNSGNRGLLAGETLGVQLKELDNAYIKKDKRRFELTEEISLRLLDPGALVDLVAEKYCKINLTPDLFDMNFKGRGIANINIKSISISVPCVTGPQVSTNVKLRVNGGEEFITSTGINDMGVFEPNFNQARYMPFEYLDLEKPENQTWELMLDEKSEFDITTISDVVLHIRFYADNEGLEANPLQITSASLGNNQSLIMSWKYDFPLEWQKYVDNIASVPPSLTVDMIPYKLRNNSFNQLDSAYLVKENGMESGIDGNDIPNYSNDIMDIWLLYK